MLRFSNQWWQSDSPMTRTWKASKSGKLNTKPLKWISTWINLKLRKSPSKETKKRIPFCFCLINISGKFKYFYKVKLKVKKGWEKFEDYYVTVWTACLGFYFPKHFSNFSCCLETWILGFSPFFFESLLYLYLTYF